MTIYVEKTTDLLYDVAIPGASGYQTMLKNIGSVQNQGYELSIDSDNLTGEFSWTTAFNISFNRNKVLELGGEDYKEMAEGDGHLKTGSRTYFIYTSENIVLSFFKFSICFLIVLSIIYVNYFLVGR